MLFDGVLSVGSLHLRMRAVPFEVVSVDGYGDFENPSVSIWIQSRNAFATGVWYRLVNPAKEYKRYFEPYLWIATLCKHFVDFSEDRAETVVLAHFKTKFYKWLYGKYRRSKQFDDWLRQYKYQTDFRSAVVAYRDYIWKECSGVNPSLKRLEIFKQVDPIDNGQSSRTAVLKQPMRESKTVATPYVHDCFKHMYFEGALRAVSFGPEVQRRRSIRMAKLGFQSPPTRSKTPSALTQTPSQMQPQSKDFSIKVGDVVSVPRDVDSIWKDSEQTWYVYVQGMRVEDQQTFLDVLWLYSAPHTTLGDMLYPYPNELFLSDHCNCRSAEKIATTDIGGTVTVDWSPSHIPSEGFFIRQKYLAEDHAFRTVDLSNADEFMCSHKQQANSKKRTAFQSVAADYVVGDTALISRPGAALLEPIVIKDFLAEEQRVLARKLLRRGRDLGYSNAKANELVWTDTTINIPASAIQRRCHIRFYTRRRIAMNRIPAPYNRNGQVDCFIISTRVMGDHGRGIVEEDLAEPFPTAMVEGFDPAQSTKYRRLRSLSLFSGGGSLDFGLDEGGATHTRWHIEWSINAVHTILANSPQPTNIFFGSVDDAMRRALNGEKSPEVPTIGDVEFIAAGSPCQAFSILQRDRDSERSLLNASKVASVVAFIDLYRPAYALLENVTTMSRVINGQNVFKQLLCSLVGMGYQVTQFQVQAPNVGTPQSRARLFVAVAAPGLEPPSQPPPTHSHPQGLQQERGLGRLINGQRFGLSGSCSDTPFHFLACKEATKDLPALGDAHPRVCITVPDHRPPITVNSLFRRAIQTIPKFPRGMGIAKLFIQAAKQNNLDKIPKDVRDWMDRQHPMRKQANSHSCQRIRPDGLFPAIVTTLTVADAKVGYGLHWDEDRVWTVMEARRAQGIPDDFVLVGSPSEQWKIVGNGVARPVALALGMVFRRAWLANTPDMVDSATSSLKAKGGPRVMKSVAPTTDGVVVVKKKLSAVERAEYEAAEDLDEDDMDQVLEVEEKELDVMGLDEFGHAYDSEINGVTGHGGLNGINGAGDSEDGEDHELNSDHVHRKPNG
jgi:DNA (cytosine-5)-methyltransferase 1